jgi:hypothetical protein
LAFHLRQRRLLPADIAARSLITVTPPLFSLITEGRQPPLLLADDCFSHYATPHYATAA